MTSEQRIIDRADRAHENSDNIEAAIDFATLAVQLSSAPDLASTRQRIVDLAAPRVGCARAALWHLPDRASHLRMDASDDPVFAAGLAELAKAMPLVADRCWHEKVNVVVQDFALDDRWPAYSEFLLRRTSVRSAAAFCLGIDDAISAVLVFYADEVNAFTAERVALGSIYAAHATIALQDAARADQAANLARALDSNRRIGMAIGVLVALYKVGEQDAFDLMRIASQRTHVKLHEVADEVILTGAAPSWPQVQRQSIS